MEAVKKRLLWTVVPAAAFIGLLAYGLSAAGSAPAIGKEVPDFEAELLSGDGTFALSDLRGKPVFVNFWWSGCVPCRKEAPILSRASKAYAGRVEFLGVNIRDAHSDAVEFARKHDLDFTHVRDEGLDIYRRYGLTGQPESFFIDADGLLVRHVAGPLSEESLFQFLDVLVARDA